MGYSPVDQVSINNGHIDVVMSQGRNSRLLSLPEQHTVGTLCAELHLDGLRPTCTMWHSITAELSVAIAIEVNRIVEINHCNTANNTITTMKCVIMALMLQV